MRKIALDPKALAALPALRGALGSPEWRGLIRYVGSRDAEPVVWIQSILRHVVDGPPDPQTALHADTFHPTVKAWLFLTDVTPDAMPFVYVPGSHRLTPQRLLWERRMSIRASQRANQPETRLVRAISRDDNDSTWTVAPGYRCRNLPVTNELAGTEVGIAPILAVTVSPPRIRSMSASSSLRSARIRCAQVTTRWPSAVNPSNRCARSTITTSSSCSSLRIATDSVGWLT